MVAITDRSALTRKLSDRIRPGNEELKMCVVLLDLTWTDIKPANNDHSLGVIKAGVLGAKRSSLRSI